MSDNSNLQKAKSRAYDEFYTLYPTILDGVSHAENMFSRKVVYLCCDDPKKSMFWKFFQDHFNEYKLKELICTYLSDKSHVFRYFGREGCMSFPIESGDFRSRDCEKYFSMCDIVVTNPPFSLFPEFFHLLMRYQKKFLIIGNVNSITNPKVFPYIQNGLCHVVYPEKSRVIFQVPDEYTNSTVFTKDGKRYASFGNICWYTNLFSIPKRFILTKTYDKKYYPKYDNFDAIEVGRVKDIPKDYMGLMGVPASYLGYHDPDLFEIKGHAGSNVPDGYSLAKELYLNEKKKYKRILIQRRADVCDAAFGGDAHVQTVDI